MTAETAVRATLDFAVAGGRTTLLRQHVPYPFHVTRPFYLDPGRPDLATLYLQSASGGLYRGERLALTITAGAASAAAITTQSATIVHDCQGWAADQSVHLALGPGSLMIYTPDPLVLFPGAAIRTALCVTLAEGAVAICQDGFACHDPSGGTAAFDHVTTETIVRPTEGAPYVTDRGTVLGRSLGCAASPWGPYRASGSLLLVGMTLADADGLQAALGELGCTGGLSRLPNGIGTAIRMLAPDGGRLAAGLRVAMHACFYAATGIVAAPRRK